MNFLALLLALVTATSPAPPSAETHAQRADRQYAEGNFAEASAAYAAAFELQPEPDYLYGWAQSERRAGNCPRALELYRQYAELDVSEAAREAARKNALRCGGSLDEAAAIGPAEPAVEPEPPPPSDSPVVDRAPERWSRDVPAISLLSTGGAIGIVSVVLGAGSATERRKATSADVEADYATHIDRSTRLRTGAIVCASLGAAAIVGGIVRYVVVARRRTDRVSLTGAGLRVRF